jgi:hypothetical protein
LSKPLSPQEIIELDRALIEAFASHQALKRRIPAARHIKFSQLPAILAESFVIAGAGRIFGPEWKAGIGRPLSDVQLSDPTGRTRRVEVKSTGHHGFQELKDKDLLADTLVWVNFGRRYHNGHGAVQIVILDNPGKYILESVRLDIPRLRRRVGDTPDLRQIEVADLVDFLLSPEQQKPPDQGSLAPA